jgi:DNA-binding transcriptional ArsR family regulator
MSERKIDLVLHPVRMRLLLALAGRALTARELAIELPDVAQATLYRHLNALADAGLITVAAERQVHSVIEKSYTAAPTSGVLGPEEIARLPPDEHFRHFTIFTATLLAMFGSYLAQGETADVLRDLVGYRQLPLYLSDAELLDLVRQMNQLVQPHLENDPTPGRRRRLFTTVLFPLDEG